MRIDSFQNIPAILQSYKPDNSSKSTSAESNTSSSSVSLSSFGEVLQSLQRQSTQAVQGRSIRLEELAQQAQAGNLSVDHQKLAANLINSNVVDTRQ
jgi:anti-sigma28 factor (negative regulator of flagellin synthesis)